MRLAVDCKNNPFISPVGFCLVLFESVYRRGHWFARASQRAGRWKIRFKIFCSSAFVKANAKSSQGCIHPHSSSVGVIEVWIVRRLPDSKFIIEHLFDDNIGDAYWFYLRDFEDIKQPPNTEP
ncbi:MAG TPA: hypothetical protein VHY30_05465 [Verrucomicrobiae bacterium]|jgi:hypothetical protein|nr:hypothetical protein [Verrucomicrobiae bacterium]